MAGGIRDGQMPDTANVFVLDLGFIFPTMVTAIVGLVRRREWAWPLAGSPSGHGASAAAIWRADRRRGAVATRGGRVETPIRARAIACPSSQRAILHLRGGHRDGISRAERQADRDVRLALASGRQRTIVAAPVMP
jgi:hypothetical protein